MGGQAVDLKRLGRRLRSARIEAGLTQKELASGDFTAAYISQVERGVVQPSLDSLARLAARLGLPLRWLFEDDDGDQHLECRMCLLTGRRLIAAGRLEEAGDYLDRALGSCREIGDRSLEASVLAALGDLALAGGKPLEATGHYTEAMEMGERAGAGRQVAICSLRLGEIYLWQGNPLLAVQYLKRARDLLPLKDALEPTLLAALGQCYTMLGEHDLAGSFGQQAVAACRRRTGWAAEVEWLGEAAIGAWSAGRRLEALEHTERAWHLAAYRRQLVRHAGLLLEGAGHAVSSESYSLADQLVEESLAICRVADDLSGLARGWLIQGRISMDRGQVERAEAQGSRAREAADREGDTEALAEAHWLLGQIETARDNVDVARHHWEESAVCFEKAGNQARMSEIFAMLGELALQQENQGLALRYFRRAARPSSPSNRQ